MPVHAADVDGGATWYELSRDDSATAAVIGSPLDSYQMSYVSRTPCDLRKLERCGSKLQCINCHIVCEFNCDRFFSCDQRHQFCGWNDEEAGEVDVFCRSIYSLRLDILVQMRPDLPTNIQNSKLFLVHSPILH